MEMLKCPLCDFQSKMLNSLKKHMRTQHLWDDTCPICNKQFKSLNSHLWNKAKRGCREHMVIYALTANGRNNRANEVKKASRDYAEVVLEVG